MVGRKWSIGAYQGRAVLKHRIAARHLYVPWQHISVLVVQDHRVDAALGPRVSSHVTPSFLCLLEQESSDSVRVPVRLVDVGVDRSKGSDHWHAVVVVHRVWLDGLGIDGDACLVLGISTPSSHGTVVDVVLQL